jgi:hypothetical protein
MEPTKQELKNWLDDPITKYVLHRVREMRTETLESSVTQVEPEMISIVVRAVGGMDRVLELMEGLPQEGEEE